MTAFAEFGVMPEIVRAVEDMEWLLPTDVQAEAIPLILGGGDVLMAAETGSGKTGAFCLPVLQVVHELLRAHGARTTTGEGTKEPVKKARVEPTRMSGQDRDGMFAVSEDGLLCQSRHEQQWQGGRATTGLVGGKHYYEALMTDEGLCRCGWSTMMATFNLGTDKHGFGFGGTGKKSYARQFDSYGETYGLNDVLGCYLDLDNMEIHYTKNGKYLGIAFEIPSQLQRAAFYPAIVVKNAELKLNFGDTPFRYPPHEKFACFKGVSHATAIERASVAANENSGKRTPLAIILEPSKELAEQTHKQVELFKKYLPGGSSSVTSVLLIGGGNTKEQIRVLQKGADIVVGTPGRIGDFLSTGKLNVSQVKFYVLDEADGLLTGGATGIIDDVFKRLPKNTTDGSRLQMIVCSATLHHPEVKKLADRMMQHPTWVDLKGQDAVPDTVHHLVCHIDPTKDTWWKHPHGTIKADGVHVNDNIRGDTPESMSAAVKTLKYKYLRKAIDTLGMDQAIIFCRTKQDCNHMEEFLLGCGGGAASMVNEYSCCCVHGDRSVQVRRANLQAFKDGERRFLICTDVAARGIDIRGVPYVINMMLPDEKENYIHRIGRVGRAERMGLALSLVSTVKEKVWYCSQNCTSRGRLPCKNTHLKEDGGCTIWYSEPDYLRAVEEHLGETIPTVDESMMVPTCEFDGKVVYGEKRGANGSDYKGHADILAPSVAELASLEYTAQTSYLALQGRTWT
eukprot:m.907818 g.907818  ORF g.907818 m.907818 type:complete len:736 (+) comp23711_c1_seq21:2004-4211(+)